jgi:hypothetical protein
MLTENWLSELATPGVGDVDVRLIQNIPELCVTEESESFYHHE